MDSEDNPFSFGDIEQDNNPSFYGNPSVINNPYGSQQSPTLTALETTVDKGKTEDHMGSASGFLDINESLVMSNRITQMLTEKSSLELEVVSTEKLMNSSVVVYCIQLSQKESSFPPIIVKRRYSEFKSLRDNLMRLFPTLIVPPIPQKHTFLNYLISSINNGEEVSIVQTRKRLFTLFLQDLVFHSNERIVMCPLLHKFLDPSYEMSWENAIHEPPVSLVPDHLLLANPIDPTNQNGLYSLLPNINGGFDYSSSSGGADNLGNLKHFNNDLGKLKEQIHLLELNSQKLKKDAQSTTPLLNEDSLLFETEKFQEIPQELINFEMSFHKSIKLTSELDKINSKTGKNMKSLIRTLLDLGSNLNNFSLQIHLSEPNPTNNDANNYNINHNNHNNHKNSINSSEFDSLSSQIEKFGSTIDLIFLNYEAYLNTSFMPKWQEPIHQLIQHYLTAVQLLRFYKLKLIQYKVLYKSRFRKSQELEMIHETFNSQQNIHEALKMSQDLNSPSISQAIRKYEMKHNRQVNKNLGKKKSWYGLFGGSKQSNTIVDNNLSKEEFQNQYSYKLDQLEKEIHKLDQLVELTNCDMISLTKELEINFNDFTKLLEKRWLIVMLDFIRGGRKLFEENLDAWKKMKIEIQ